MRAEWRAAPAAIVLVVALAAPAAAADDDLTLDDFPPVSDARLGNVLSVHHYTNLDGVLVAPVYDPDPSITRLADVDTEDDETVVTLTSDILFAPDSADLSSKATARIGDLVADVPKGAKVQVDGHTDSVDSTAHNAALSKRRAQAVADAIGAARPDLHLSVHGYGESRLKVPEQGDDIAQDRATNRRVEVRYTSGDAEASPSPSASDRPAAPTGTLGVAPAPSWADVATEATFKVPGRDGVTLRVGVEPLVVRGRVMQLSVLLEPTSGDEMQARDVRDSRWAPTLVDTDNLVQYSVLSNTGLAWTNDPLGGVTLAPGAPARIVTTYPAPVADVTKVDVTLADGWPVLTTGVPVTVAGS